MYVYWKVNHAISPPGSITRNANYDITLTKNKIWEWYGKAWAICGPYVGIVWEG